MNEAISHGNMTYISIKFILNARIGKTFKNKMENI